jgi:hypothetical protein
MNWRLKLPIQGRSPGPTAEGDEHSDPLFDSKRSYVDQIDIYKRHQQRPTEKRAYGTKRRESNGEAAP